MSIKYSWALLSCDLWDPEIRTMAKMDCGLISPFFQTILSLKPYYCPRYIRNFSIFSRVYPPEHYWKDIFVKSAYNSRKISSITANWIHLFLFFKFLSFVSLHFALIPKYSQGGVVTAVRILYSIKFQCGHLCAVSVATCDLSLKPLCQAHLKCVITGPRSPCGLTQVTTRCIV